MSPANVYISHMLGQFEKGRKNNAFSWHACDFFHCFKISKQFIFGLEMSSILHCHDLEHCPYHYYPKYLLLAKLHCLSQKKDIKISEMVDAEKNNFLILQLC